MTEECASERFPRALTRREREVLEALLAVVPSRHDTTDLQVVGTCQCGCPTIDFASQGKSWPIAEAIAKQPFREVLLFANADGLTSLELVFGRDDLEFPAPQLLEDLRARN